MRFLILALFVSFVGCGGPFSVVPVSGTVTLDGKPLPGVEVVFAPMERQDVVEVGPASVGVTDEQGKYTLKTVGGLNGAVATSHRVSIAFPEVSEAEVAAKIDEAVNKNRSIPEAQVMALEKKIRRSMKNSRSLPESYNVRTKLQIEINGATDKANFDLKSDGS